MIFVWLHVVAVFMGFAALISSDLLLVFASRIQSAESARAMVKATTWIGALGKVLIVLGIGVGLYVTHAFGFGFRSGWLLWTYGLTALSIVLGAAAFEPMKKRILNSATDGMAHHTSSRRRFPIIVLVLNPACWMAILWLMIAKPGL